jgi:SsrA-binding protein
MSTKKSKPTKSQSAKPTDSEVGKTISENRKASHRFEILEKLECGVVLLGSEVKSLREGKISLDEAYVRVRDDDIWLVGADIAEYRQANRWNHNPKRPRKLLVHAKQLRKLAVRANEKGLTLVPLRIYFNSRGMVKLLVGVCRGKKLFDKRESKKAKDVKRDIDRAMKSRPRR